MQEANTYLQLILQDNENLTNNFVVYNNLRIKIKFKNKDKGSDDINLSDQEKQELEYYMNNFRSYATRIKIKFQSIKDQIGITEKQEKDFFEFYSMINSEPLPEPSACEDFVQIVNDILAQKISAYEALISSEQKDNYTDSASAPNITEE